MPSTCKSKLEIRCTLSEAEKLIDVGYDKKGNESWYCVKEPTRLYYSRSLAVNKAKEWLRKETVNEAETSKEKRDKSVQGVQF